MDNTNINPRVRRGAPRSAYMSPDDLIAWAIPHCEKREDGISGSILISPAVLRALECGTPNEIVTVLRRLREAMDGPREGIPFVATPFPTQYGGCEQ